MITPHYTSLIQPCDSGINKPLKDRLKHLAGRQRLEKHRTIILGDKLLSPKRADASEQLSEILQRFPSEVAKNSFKSSGCFYEEGIDYNGETEFDFNQSNHLNYFVCKI